MGISTYLPSTQFSIVLTSIALAGGLIWVADYYTSPKSPPSVSSVQAPSALTTNGLDWKAALAAIQGEGTLPTPPSEETVTSLLAAAETSNVTASVGRTLLVNLGEAKAQGLGSDIPTQERIVANALTKVTSAQDVELYTLADLTTAEENEDAYRVYGNGVVGVLEQYPEASVEAVLLAVGNATDSSSASHLNTLKAAKVAYEAIARDLRLLPVPQTLSPLHLQVVNNFVRIAGATTDMQTVLTDPLRGLAGLKEYQLRAEETTRLFINIAQTFNKNGILFSEDEPGAAWGLLVQP